MDQKEINALNTTTLAFLGDAVYEVYVRRHVMQKNPQNTDDLHRRAVGFVRAEAQGAFIKKAAARSSEEDGFLLTPEELSLVKRARNRRSATKPKNADPVVYKWATAFEALIGYLYLTEQTERMEEFIDAAILEIPEMQIRKSRRRGWRARPRGRPETALTGAPEI